MKFCLATVVVLAACSQGANGRPGSSDTPTPAAEERVAKEEAAAATGTVKGKVGAPSRERFTATADRDAALAQKAERALFAGGCFWGMEHYFERAPGVLSVTTGFAGDERPASYREVSAGKTDHAEVVEILYDPNKTDYEALARLFFEIHDPTQKDRQGPDVGRQYRSAVYYDTDAEKATVQQLIGLLEKKGLKVVTELEKAGAFVPAADYHQDYYERTGGEPYCHIRTPRFDG